MRLCTNTANDISHTLKRHRMRRNLPPHETTIKNSQHHQLFIKAYRTIHLKTVSTINYSRTVNNANHCLKKNQEREIQQKTKRSFPPEKFHGKRIDHETPQDDDAQLRGDIPQSGTFERNLSHGIIEMRERQGLAQGLKPSRKGVD